MATKYAPVKTVRRKKATNASAAKTAKRKEAKKDLSKSYNEYKDFEGQQYSGMKVGRSHKCIMTRVNGRKQKLPPTYGKYLML